MACCVSGCKNRYSSSSKLKFFRVPSGSRPFQANRRRLWLQAIQKVNGSTEELSRNARICGAHFKSREASMDHDSPDFVPSVFTYAEQTHKRKVKWFFGRRKRRRRTAKTDGTGEQTAPSRCDSPVELQSSALTEDILTPSTPSNGETLTKKAVTESETTPIKTRTTPSFEAPAGFPVLDKGSPIVLLKHVYAPAGGYQCDQCNQKFTNASQLIKHKHLHEEESVLMCEMCGKIFTSQADFTEHRCVQEPSFPCNICDRSFASSHNLKRHKLQHVKDGRKCRQCGVLFCRRHKHILYVPRTESVPDYEEVTNMTEPQNLDSDLTPENHLPEKPEPSQTADLDDNAQSTMTVSPVPQNYKAPSPASHTEILPPVFLIPPSLSSVPPPVPRIPQQPDTSPHYDYPVASIQPLPQDIQLPPSLKMFSPQYLTSALLQVQRNYEYILSKPGVVKNKKNIVKVEHCELPVISPAEQSIEHVKKERTAYDLEIVL
ncbi:zinc finger protein 117-like [Plectropomus leopardus]|uniref:zinc finger protein 117-like n=1 Tax=Plectropomus leopardus TaxID=160734 RepID=UPI001C4D359D|nr:zinc finger protein 117-like [Plectropomus leopardus]